MDRSLVANRDLGGARVTVDFTGTGKASPDSKALDEGVFENLKIHRSPQAPMTGGGVTDFNRFAFE